MAEMGDLLAVLDAAFEMRKPGTRAHVEELVAREGEGARRLLRQAATVRKRPLPIAHLVADLRLDMALAAEHGVGPEHEAQAAELARLRAALRACIETSRREARRLTLAANGCLARARALQDLLDKHRNKRERELVTLYGWAGASEGNVVLGRGTDLGPTPEMMAGRPSRIAPIPEMYANGHINLDQVRAAKEIQWVVEGMTKKLDARAGSYGVGGGAGFWRDTIAPQVLDVYSARYRPWCAAQRALEARRQRHLSLTLDVVVMGVGLDEAARHHRMWFYRARKIIQNALADYAATMPRHGAGTGAGRASRGRDGGRAGKTPGRS